MTLGEIHWYHMKSYKAARVAGDPPFIRKRRPQEPPPPCPPKPKQVNQELRLVKKLKRMAGCWTTQDQEYFEYLQEEESDAERVLAPVQQQRWLDVCRSNQRFDLILWWSIASFDMLTSTNELRGLQLGNVNLQQRLATVNNAIQDPFITALYARQFARDRIQQIGKGIGIAQRLRRLKGDEREITDKFAFEAESVRCSSINLYALESSCHRKRCQHPIISFFTTCLRKRHWESQWKISKANSCLPTQRFAPCWDTGGTSCAA